MDQSLKTLSDITVWSKYAKYLPELNRRETWDEIIDRYEVTLIKKYPQMKEEIVKNTQYIREFKVLPSMRTLQFSGTALEVNNARAFNCCFLPIDSVHAFSETMFLLLGGSGVGYSVQNHHIEKLPAITIPTKKRKYVVDDSLIGWADAIKVLMKAYFEGKSMPVYDLSDIRPKGARLVTAGGKAPGPEPLKECLFQIQKVLDRKKDGEKLTSLEIHSIICHIANAVLSGGIRRSSLICLFDHTDEAMLTCKYGNWWEKNEEFGRSNNSAVLVRGEISEEEFFDLWERIQASGSGEPGLYWTEDQSLGSNPCCFTGDNRILTESGYRSFFALNLEEGIKFYNKDGDLVEGKVWSTGYKQVIELTLSNNTSIVCTPDHVFLLAHGEEEIAANLIGQTLKGFDGNNQTVCKIQTIGIRKVYDFTLYDETHWGVVEGVIAHNCEISLKPNQFCNLCDLNVSNVESQEDLNERARVGSFFGTLQAGLTDFHYLREIWKKTTDEEALIGVGMTGIGSGEILKYDLKEATEVVREENIRVAALIGINPAARTTTVKPSGTTSCVLGTSSGIHAWHSEYYLRTLRFNKNEAIAQYIMENHPGLWEDDKLRPHDTVCVRIPIKAPENAIMRTETAIDTLERVKKFSLEWVKPGHVSGANTHNVSATISIDKERKYKNDFHGYDWTGNPVYGEVDEWQKVGQWMWDNREVYNGLSVLPYDGGSYIQAPFEEITKEEYEERVKLLKDIDLHSILEYDDNVQFDQVSACAGGACLVD